MKMKHPKTGNIVDVAAGCIDTMLKRGWKEVKPVIKNQIAAEAKENVKS